MPPPTATDTSSPVPGAGRVERLPSGLTIVSETMPGVRSAALGLWVTAGSRCEAPGQEGMAHFWEHLAFKGTAHRSAADIARELDRLGGLANAFTGREETCYHARVAGNRLAPAFEVLSDIVRAPKPSDTDIALEKGVVEQEIAMVEETPEDLAFETFWQNVWSDPGLAHSILGTPESVAAFSAKTLNTWRATSYRPSRLMVCAAGAVDHAQLKELTLRAFGESAPDEAAAPLPPGIFRRAATALEGDSEQAHLILGFPAPGLAGEERYALACLNAALGGQMSSRLFQEVRERRGLAYAISSEHQGTATEGCLTIYAAVAPERVSETLSVIRAELERLAADGLTAAELAQAKEHLSGLFILGAESTEERMFRLARNELLHHRQIGLDETERRLAAVDGFAVKALAARLLSPGAAALTVLAPRVSPAWAGTFDLSFEGGGRP